MERLPLKAVSMCIIAALLCIIAHDDLCAQESPIVNAIEIKGLKRTEETAVKSRITQKVGEPLSTDKTAEDIKNIYKMGYFDDVKIEVEPFEGGIKLIYVVKEKPTIIRVEFQGNKEIKDDKLKEKITVTAGSIADTTLIQDNAAKLQQFYEEEGYWTAQIVPVVDKVTEDEVALTYVIKEGEKVKIKKIQFEGNKAISSGAIKKVMKTSTWWIFSFITSSGYYKKETMNADIEAIRDLYYNNGYLKVVVADPVITFTENKKGMVITIRISEGDQYKVSSVKVTGNKVFPEAQLKDLIKLSPGMVFSKAVLQKDTAAVADLYTRNGYALANVFPDIVPDEASKEVNVTYKVEEGDIYRIGRIEISGNTKTKDKVIRREIRLDEGDIFDSSLVKRSYERINNLNFFETVELVPKPRYEEKFLDVDVRVKEKSTGFISVGGGYSSVDKIIGMVDITQSNIGGTGQLLRLRGELGGTSSFYELSFRDPWFMDKPIAFSADVYRTYREYVEYDKKATGFGFGFGKSLSEYVSGNISYNFEVADIYNVSETADTLVKRQEGSGTTSSITTSVARDTRDNYLDPTRGSRNSAYFTFAGIGGTNAFIKGLADSAWFFPLGSTTIALRGRLGYATGLFGKDLPLYERFYVGGIYTVRGLGFGEAGPRDSQSGDVIGGLTELIFNTEFIFPIFRELKVKGVLFFDAGNSYDAGQSQSDPFGQLRYTTGTGIRWISPLGPIRVEWGYNIKKRPGEASSKVEFAFGSVF
jgi:outer membrane protein insertion porin family